MSRLVPLVKEISGYLTPDQQRSYHCSTSPPKTVSQGTTKLAASLSPDAFGSKTELVDEEAEEHSMHWCTFKGK
ncbi:unnamed protein product [Boreogadus saida]